MQGKRQQDRTSISSVILTHLLIVAQAGALPGDLDPNFGPAGGSVLSDLGGLELDERIADAALQSDGKIVVLGSREPSALVQDFLVARYNANGSLDSSFGGGDGFVTVADPATAARPGGIAIQSDGKIVFAGGQGFSAYVFRLNSDGSLDTSFSGDGLQTVASAGEAHAVMIDSAGKIVLATYAPSPGNLASLVRLNGDGSLDTSFDGDGRRSFGADIYFPRGLAIQPDGDIVVAGKSSTSVNVGDVALVRVLDNGSLDPTFDGDGILNTNIADRHGEARGIAIQADGKIVIAGGLTGAGNSFFDPVVMRFDASGSFDTTFDVDGIRQIELTGDDQNVFFNDIAIGPDGTVMAVSDDPSGYHFFNRHELKVVRFDSSGALDNTFDDNGVAVSQVCEDGAKLLIQPNGRIVSAGNRDRSRNDGDSVDGLCVQRFTANGSVDLTFNPEVPDGTAILDLLAIAAVAELPSGKILIGGWRELSGTGTYEAVLMRLNQNGTFDSSFMDDGEYTPPVTSGHSRFLDIDILADGGFIASGEGGSLGAMLVRFTPTGIPDTSFSSDGAAFSTSASRYNAVTVRPDGKVIGCGSTGSGTRSGRIGRFSATGGFETSVVNTFATVSGSSEILDCQSLIDNRVIVVGYGSDGTSEYATISRHGDLAIDTAFGNSGIALAASSPKIDERSTGLALQSSGKILVSTTALDNDGSRNFGVFRANSDGTPDDQLASFGNGGLASIGFGFGINDDATALLLEPGGAMIVGGTTNSSPTSSFALAKLNSDGALRLGWGTLGRTSTNFAGSFASLRSLALTADGNVLAVGEISNGTAAIAKYQNVLVPTAAKVTVSGRVVDPSGRAIARAVIVLTDHAGTERYAITNTFGYFRFSDVAVGGYIISAQHRSFRFESQFAEFLGDTDGIKIVAARVVAASVKPRASAR
jgi:uncharacterized delta-60 repeat protein